MSTLPWYSEGLNFKCTGCGGCCTGFPGFVWVTAEEITLMAEKLNIPIKEFTRRFLRDAGGRMALKEDPKSYDCVFLADKKRCTMYDVRPKQCKTFPFWPHTISSKEAWDETALHCEGINKDSPLVNLETIEKNLNA